MGAGEWGARMYFKVFYDVMRDGPVRNEGAKALVELWRDHIEKKAGDKLDALTESLDDQQAFANVAVAVGQPTWSATTPKASPAAALQL